MKKTITTFIIASTMAMTSVSVLAQDVRVISAPVETVKFTDISGHWAESDIKKLANPEIFTVKDGVFAPDQLITRSEFVQMLHKALGIQIKYVKAPDIKEFFNDVKNEDPEASELYDLVVSNIIDDKGSFKPNEILRRDEMIYYTMNALKDATGGNYAIIKMMPAPYNDDDKITPAYKYDIVEAKLLKIIYGRGENMFYPQNGSTRAEAATIISRLINTIEKFNGIVDIQPSVETKKDSMTLRLAITNRSKEPVTINHTSGQKYDFALLDSGMNVLYRWSADKMFIMALTSTVIEAGQTVEFTAELDKDVYSSYEDRIHSMTAFITGTSEAFTVNPDGYEMQIK